VIDVTVYFYSGDQELGRSYSLANGSTIQDLKQAISTDGGSPFSGRPVANFGISVYPAPDPRVALAGTQALVHDNEYHAAMQ
jgi:hypothetical protein